MERLELRNPHRPSCQNPKELPQNRFDTLTPRPLPGGSLHPAKDDPSKDTCLSTTVIVHQSVGHSDRHQKAGAQVCTMQYAASKIFAQPLV